MPERYPPEDPREWLNRARSNLALAKVKGKSVYLLGTALEHERETPVHFAQIGACLLCRKDDGWVQREALEVRYISNWRPHAVDFFLQRGGTPHHHSTTQAA